MQLKTPRKLKRFPFQKASLPRYLTQEEVKRLFSVISSPRDRALLALIYHYGLRVEEATLLTLESVDLKNLHIRIQRLKNGVSSQKPLWRHNAKLLRSYLRMRQDAGHWLFTGRQGPLKKRQIQTLFTEYAKQAGIKGRAPCMAYAIRSRCTSWKQARALSTWRITWATRISRTPPSMRRSPRPYARKSLSSWSAIPRL